MGNCNSSCMPPWSSWIYSIFGNSWPVTSSPSSSMPAIESIRGMYHKIDPPEQIDPFIGFIENEIQKMKNPSEAGPSSSEGWLETVKGGIELAGNTVDTIYTEAEKLSQSQEDAVKAMESLMLAVMKGMGEWQLVFVGLSVAAFAVQSYTSFGSTDNECRELLLKILELVKAVNECREFMADRREERVRNAVGTIVEGALICHDYKRGNVFRFWSATSVAAQLEKTNQQIRNVTDSLALSFLQRHWDKDAFLSHSGKQKNFVRQLYQDLTSQHVSCFFDEDDDSLPLGEKFPRLIFKAAETCKTAVVVLSKEFIISKWPMQELSAFNKAKKTGNNDKLQIIPIFFKIRPDEVFQIIKDNPEWKKMEESDVRKSEWNDALKEVRSINGLQLFENGNEVDCRDKVVKAICRFLMEINPPKPPNPPKLLDFEPVGIEKEVDEVKALLDMEGAQSALAVIVCGFGGVGKSTIAASAVQSLDWSSTEFKFCMVAINETTDKTSHIIQLQKYIIDRIGGDKSDFQNLEDGRPKIQSAEDGRLKIQSAKDGQREIQAAVQNKCSLLFIDNVDNKDYVRDLLPRDWRFREGKTKLRILITCRQKTVKAELGIMCKEYDVNPLSDADSESLLLQTIVEGEEEVEDKEFDERRMIKDVAVACRGVPLLLSVFGKHLTVARDKNNYEEALNVLREGSLNSYRDEDLGTKLMFVYEKIPVEFQEAFLDICAYFVGWEWNLVADIVDEDIKILEDLRRRMLVSKNESGEVIVHDILCLMGMKKARLTRFSNYEKLSDALEDKLEPVKGISLVNDKSLITIQSTQLEDMRQSLRVLMLGDWVTMDGPPCHKAFTNLRYLSVDRVSFLPPNSNVSNSFLGVLIWIVIIIKTSFSCSWRMRCSTSAVVKLLRT